MKSFPTAFPRLPLPFNFYSASGQWYYYRKQQCNTIILHYESIGSDESAMFARFEFRRSDYSKIINGQRSVGGTE